MVAGFGVVGKVAFSNHDDRFGGPLLGRACDPSEVKQGVGIVILAVAVAVRPVRIHELRRLDPLENGCGEEYLEGLVPLLRVKVIVHVEVANGDDRKTNICGPVGETAGLFRAELGVATSQVDRDECKPLVGLRVAKRRHERRAVLPIIEAVAAVLEEFGDAFESQACGVEGKEQPVAPPRVGKEVAVLLAVGSADGLAVPVGVPRVNFLQGEHVVAAQFCELFGDGRRVAAAAFDVPAHHAERFCACGSGDESGGGYHESGERVHGWLWRRSRGEVLIAPVYLERLRICR